MFNRFLKIETKRTILRWQTLIAFCIFITIFIHISTLNKLDIPATSQYPVILVHEENNPFINYINAFAGASNSYMPLIFPLIILLIVGDSLFLDYNTSYLNYIACRLNFKKHIKYKILSISIISFIITFVFQTIGFLYSYISSDKYLPTNVAIEKNIAPSLNSNLYVHHPFIYIFIFILTICMCSMTISVFSLITASLFKHIFAAISMPWVFYLILGELFMFIAPQDSIFYSISPITMFSTYVFDNINHFIYVIGYWIILWLISSMLAYNSYKKKINIM